MRLRIAGDTLRLSPMTLVRLFRSRRMPALTIARGSVRVVLLVCFLDPFILSAYYALFQQTEVMCAEPLSCTGSNN